MIISTAKNKGAALSCLLALVAVARPASGRLVSQDENRLASVRGDYFRPGVSAAEVLEARGFLAKEFRFTTGDGYVLNIVRGRNPLFSYQKQAHFRLKPVLFVHATISSAALYLINSEGVRPRNFRKLFKDLTELSNSDRLYQALGPDPSTKSLAFLLLNFGYEVWLVDRRGFGKSRTKLGHENRTMTEALASIPGSIVAHGFSMDAGQEPRRAERPESAKLTKKRKKKEQEQREQQLKQAGGRETDTRKLQQFKRDLLRKMVSLENLAGALTDFGQFERDFIQTFDPDFWNFSLDEGIGYDFPEALDFVLDTTDQEQAHVVSLSAGGAIVLLASAEQPELADKIASCVLWEPSLTMGSRSDIAYQLGFLSYLAQSSSVPIPFIFNHKSITGLLQHICDTELMQRAFCSQLVDIFFGYSAGQSPLSQSAAAIILHPTSSRELMHLGQFARTHRPCKFGFNSAKENLAAYGQPKPPCYDLGRSRLRHVSLYSGATDRLVSPADVRATVLQLRQVNVRQVLIDEPGIFFAHGGSVLNVHANRLVVLPSLLDIERANFDSS